MTLQNGISQQEKSNILIKHLFKVLSTGANACLQYWLTKIDEFIDDALLQLQHDNKIIKLLNYYNNVYTFYRCKCCKY